MSKEAVILVFLIACSSSNQSNEDAATPMDSSVDSFSKDSTSVDSSIDAITDSPVDATNIDAPIDTLGPPADAHIDATVDAEVPDAPVDSMIDTSATCISHIGFSGRNAHIVTSIFCQDSQVVSIRTEIFEGDTSLNSIIQGGLGCGSFASWLGNGINGFPNRATIVLHVENTRIFKDCTQIIE